MFQSLLARISASVATSTELPVIGEELVTWLTESVETVIWVLFNLATPIA